MSTSYFIFKDGTFSVNERPDNQSQPAVLVKIANRLKRFAEEPGVELTTLQKLFLEHVTSKDDVKVSKIGADIVHNIAIRPLMEALAVIMNNSLIPADTLDKGKAARAEGKLDKMGDTTDPIECSDSDDLHSISSISTEDREDSSLDCSLYSLDDEDINKPGDDLVDVLLSSTDLTKSDVKKQLRSLSDPTILPDEKIKIANDLSEYFNRASRNLMPGYKGPNRAIKQNRDPHLVMQGGEFRETSTSKTISRCFDIFLGRPYGPRVKMGEDGKHRFQSSSVHANKNQSWVTFDSSKDCQEPSITADTEVEDSWVLVTKDVPTPPTPSGEKGSLRM